ncbi:DUF2975 domain-containing protein [Francisella hispaniensis]|uniref:Hypothetical membrane protein n=1 Tax=Francisella hispaniensis TaxID=622488 RepID=F4BKQ0_9GAMM|nr:DUF2975 domain-containing protein [Francisella hispaniensis]AEB28744.1 hypothetical membrane protein [Francisella hispaniensis]
MKKLQRMTKLYKWLLCLIFPYEIIIYIWLYLYGKFTITNGNTTIYLTAENFSEKVVLVTKLLLLLTDMIPLIFFLYTIGLLIKIFDLCTKLEILSSKVVSLYKRLGWTIICWTIAGLITYSLQSVIYSYNIPEGRSIYFNISTDDVCKFMIGAGVIIIAYIMQEAKKILDKNNLKLDGTLI